jgi:membrane protease YdiL (CAAX protease family)
MSGESIPISPSRRLPTALTLVLAMTLPTLLAWLYFVALAAGRHANFAQQATYAAGKVVQFSIPLLFLALVVRRWPRWQRPRPAGLALGMGFGLLVAIAILGAYFGGLRSSSLLAQTPERIHAKLEQFGVTSPAAYLALAAFLCVAHSLLEEYYWRWFVFGRLRQLLPLAPALLLASLAFAAHHVIILWAYLPGKVLTGVVPAALGIAVGGAVWAWVYERSGSLLGPWLSHLLIDAALLAVGWDLLFGRSSR